MLKPFSLDRMVEALEAVRERLLRATAALRQAGIPYGVAGGNAVAAWVARVDRAAVRNTQDVDLLVQRSDFCRIKPALENVGFFHHELMGIDCFIDGPDGSHRDAVHLLYAGEKVQDIYPVPSPEVTETEPADNYDVVTLDGLLRMKLNAFRDKDRMHLRDLLALNLINATWLPKLPPLHAERLLQLINDPEG